MTFELLLRWPNLGHPCLVQKSQHQYITLHALFGTTHKHLNLKSLLNGNLYLQSFAATRRVLQDENIYNVAQMDPFKDRLIPIKFEKAQESSKSTWSWYDIDFNFACWVALKIETKHFKGFKIPQLFNIIHDFPNRSYYNVNFHSVYIHEKDWRNFTFAHVADPHIAWRNEEIPFVMTKRSGEPPKAYNNPNENFRTFIKYSNRLHKKGKLDFILLNGDIVDYIYENYYGRRTLEDRFSLNNFEYFVDIVKGKPRKQQCLVGEQLFTVTAPQGEELEVPLFTVLGNHDYRPNEYPLIFRIGTNLDPFIIPFLPLPLETAMIPITHLFSMYHGLNLDRREALHYEGRLQDWDEQTAGKFVDAIDKIPPTYASLVNPDRDYFIQLGKHTIICLDTSHDEGIFQGQRGYLLSFFDESKSDFREGSPDSSGFVQEQIQFLKNRIKDTDGLVIIVFHAPMVNIHGNTPHHLLRESEHENLISKGKSNDLWYYLRKNGLSHPTSLPSDKGFLPEGWSLVDSAFFKVGDRDPYLGKGVTDHKFKEFLEVITEKTQKDKNAVLVLTGHTHRDIEYIVRLKDNETRYYHDYYIDNTVNGQTPQERWKDSSIPNYPEPHSVIENRSINPKSWWHQHTPLFVQTRSLGPKSGDKPVPERGILLITVESDIINGMKRVSLSDMHEEIEGKATKQAFFILSTAKP